MAMTDARRRLPVAQGRVPVDESALNYEHPLYQTLLALPGLSVATGVVDQLLEWGVRNSLWVFPMATSCCGIELMSAAASRVDLDRMGTIVRGTPRQADVMVIAGTITTKMAPRVKVLWEQMPEPKWALAMGSCAISGDFYRNLYPVVPGIDTVLPVDVYVPGCPPNPEALMHGLLRLQEKIRQRNRVTSASGPSIDITRPTIPRLSDPTRERALDDAQYAAAVAVSAGERSDEPADGVDGPFVEADAPAPPEVSDDFDAILRDRFGITERPTDGAPIVPVERHRELARTLRAAGYRQLVYIVATHCAAKALSKTAPERFEVAYGLRTIGKGSRLASWRLQLDPGASAPSLVGLFAGADMQEREQFDLVGVRFEGHPDLRRIMLVDNFEGHPLRRDFPSDAACPPWR